MVGRFLVTLRTLDVIPKVAWPAAALLSALVETGEGGEGAGVVGVEAVTREGGVELVLVWENVLQGMCSRLLGLHYHHSPRLQT